MQRVLRRVAKLSALRPARCAADARVRPISFNWGGQQEVKAPHKAQSLSKHEANEHRNFIVRAAETSEHLGEVRERLGLLMADKLPFGKDVCLAMVAAGIRLNDPSKVIYWTDITTEEGYSLPEHLAVPAIVALSGEAQHSKAAALVLSVLGCDVGAGMPSDSVATESPPISDTKLLGFVDNHPASVLISASTSLIKSGHVSLAFRMQEALIATATCNDGHIPINAANQHAKIACLEKMSVLWLPAGQAEACLNAYRALSSTGHSMPLSLLSQLLHAAAEASEWELCKDILDARHHFDAGEAGVIAMDSSLKPIIIQACSSAGPTVAVDLLTRAAAWLGHSMPDSAAALASTLSQQGHWLQAQAVAQHLLRRPRGKSTPPTNMACVGAIAGHLLMQGHGHAAARMLFAAVRAWDGRWKLPADVSDAWLRAQLSSGQPPSTDEAAQQASSPLGFCSLRPVAPHVGTVLSPSRATLQPAAPGLVPASALLAHSLAQGHSPSAYACTATAQAALLHGDYNECLDIAANAVVAASYDAFVPLAPKHSSQVSTSAAGQWTPAAVDSLTASLHGAALNLLQRGEVAPLEALARLLSDVSLMHVSKADAAKAAGSTATALATALQWNALAAITHACGAAVQAVYRLDVDMQNSQKYQQLRQLAQVLHLTLPIVADHMHSHPPRQRSSHAISSGFSLLSVSDCCSAAMSDALLLPACAAEQTGSASAATALDVGIAALRCWLRRQGHIAAAASNETAFERASVAALATTAQSTEEADHEHDEVLFLPFPLARLQRSRVDVFDRMGSAHCFAGAVLALPHVHDVVEQSAPCTLPGDVDVAMLSQCFGTHSTGSFEDTSSPHPTAQADCQAAPSGHSKGHSAGTSGQVASTHTSSLKRAVPIVPLARGEGGAAVSRGGRKLTVTVSTS